MLYTSNVVKIIDKIFKLFKKILQSFHKHIRIIVMRYEIDSNNFLLIEIFFLQSLIKKF